MFGIAIDRRRIFGLDFLRAFAILCVIHSHTAFLLNGTQLEWLIHLPMLHGVDMFFVLSGFLIGGAFLSHSETHNGIVDKQKMGRFYAKTALRILPNYYFILLIYYILTKSQIITGDVNAFSIWYFITLTQNLFTPFYNFFWESWTLPVEWWFYILFPILLVVTSRFVHPRKSIPFICLFFVVFSILYRIMVSDHAVDDFWWGCWIRKTVASRIDGIFIGVMAAWFKAYLPEKWNRYGIMSFVAGMLLMTLLCMIKHPAGTFYSNVLYSSLLPVAIVLWLPLLCRWQSYKTVIGSMVAHLSVLSYALFLTNLMVTQIITTQCPEWIQHHGILSYILCWALAFVSAYALYILVEKPFMNLRKRL